MVSIYCIKPNPLFFFIFISIYKKYLPLICWCPVKQPHSHGWCLTDAFNWAKQQQQHQRSLDVWTEVLFGEMAAVALPQAQI